MCWWRCSENLGWFTWPYFSIIFCILAFGTLAFRVVWQIRLPISIAIPLKPVILLWVGFPLFAVLLSHFFAWMYFNEGFICYGCGMIFSNFLIWFWEFGWWFCSGFFAFELRQSEFEETLACFGGFFPCSHEKCLS